MRDRSAFIRGGETSRGLSETRAFPHFGAICTAKAQVSPKLHGTFRPQPFIFWEREGGRAFAARVQKKIRPHCNLCDSLRWVQLGCTHFHCSLCIAPQRTHTTPRGHVGREEAILGEGKAAPEFAQLGLSGNEKKKGRAAIHAPPFHPPVHPERVQMVQADNELLPAASILPISPGLCLNCELPWNSACKTPMSRRSHHPHIRRHISQPRNSSP